MIETRGQPAVDVPLEDFGVRREKIGRAVDHRVGSPFWKKRTIRAYFQRLESFVRNYTQRERDVLLAINKEEVMRPIEIRSGIGVKITNEEGIRR